MNEVETKIYKNVSLEDCRHIGEMLRDGKLVAIPTETVYGLGANALDVQAVKRIFEAKGRPSDNPLILHVPNVESIAPLVNRIGITAHKLMSAFWPGPLTITLPKSPLVPYQTTGGLETVALRCPDNYICQKILEAAEVPIAAPSANISGRPSPTTAEDVYRDMNGRIDAIVDAGPCQIGVESTVVECGDDEVIILRPGGITEEMLLQVVSKVSYDAALITGSDQPKAPGMKYKHYAPEAEMTTYVGTSQAVAANMMHVMRTAPVGKKIALLISEETKVVMDEYLKEKAESTYVVVYGSQQEPQRLAHCLYSSLLAFNEAKVDIILAEGIENTGVGVAIMNRMTKASNQNIIKV